MPIPPTTSPPRILLSALALAATAALSPAAPPYADYLEPGFPFTEATVDARHLGDTFPADNLTPRALVLRLGEDTYAAFDTDLLRLSAAWHGGFLTPDTIAMRSYQNPRDKMGPGQESLPKPVGTPIVANGLYPGWSVGDPVLEDPRHPGADPREIGRGSLPPGMGRFNGVYANGSQAVLSYRVGDCEIREVMSVTPLKDGTPVLVRGFALAAHDEPLSLVVGAPHRKFLQPGEPTTRQAQTGQAIRLGSLRGPNPSLTTSDTGHTTVRFPPSDTSTIAWVAIWAAHRSLSEGVFVPEIPELIQPSDFSALTSHTSPRPTRWPERPTTAIERAPTEDAPFVLDRIALPEPNPWKRAVLPSDIAFFDDGTAALLTYDGDVYRVAGLDSNTATWQRLASGFHEPQGIAIRDGHLFVFSRGGLSRLHDFNGDGEADYYELFANNFSQSADTRDYAHSLANAPDGGFYLTKGGQQNDFLAAHSGRALHVSPDGQEMDIVATGLRNGFLEFDSETGHLIATDQQGHWVPATPFHVLHPGGYYGFQPAAPQGVPEPSLAAPATWIPHLVAQSGVGLVPIHSPEMGHLQGSILFIDYFRPSLTQILPDYSRQPPEAAAVPIPLAIDAPLLKGATRPADGLVYLAGFQGWGSNATDTSGFFRLRPGRAPSPQPVAASTFSQGVHLRFAHPLSPAEAADPASYRATSWSYRRSKEYGSGQFKADGTDGTDPLFIHSVLLSPDRQGVFLAIPNMIPIDQLEVAYTLASARGHPIDGAAYFTPRSLPPLRPAAAGFAPVDFDALFAGDPTPRAAATTAAPEPASARRGKDLYSTYGCVACHSVDGSAEGKAGPTWKALAGSQRPLIDGSTATADTAYLRRAILDPAAEVVAGYHPKDAGMPSYRGILSDPDIESLILYIRSL
ncbi:hypothetical protein BH23VER1_BH23VER1_15490 [soil metagenome]